MRVFIKLEMPTPEHRKVYKEHSIEERVEEAVTAIEANAPEYDDCEDDWTFLVKTFLILSKKPKLKPNLLTKIEDFLSKHGIFEGQYAPLIDAQMLNKGSRE